jgi:hypothetical protein
MGTMDLNPYVEYVGSCISEFLKHNPKLHRLVPLSRVSVYCYHKRLKRIFSLEHRLSFLKLPNTGKPHFMNSKHAYDELHLTLDFTAGKKT